MLQQERTRRLIYLALLIAMNIVFVRFLSFQTPIIRLDFGFIPIFLAGSAFGPLWGGLAGGCADILGMLINSKGMIYFFPWTLNAILHGVLYGLFLYQKEKTWQRVVACVLLQGVLINLLLGSIWGTLYGMLYLPELAVFWAVFTKRFFTVLITVPVQIVTITVLCRILKPHIKEL